MYGFSFTCFCIHSSTLVLRFFRLVRYADFSAGGCDDLLKGPSLLTLPPRGVAEEVPKDGRSRELPAICDDGVKDFCPNSRDDVGCWSDELPIATPEKLILANRPFDPVSAYKTAMQAMNEHRHKHTYIRNTYSETCLVHTSKGTQNQYSGTSRLSAPQIQSNLTIMNPGYMNSLIQQI